MSGGGEVSFCLFFRLLLSFRRLMALELSKRDEETLNENNRNDGSNHSDIWVSLVGWWRRVGDKTTNAHISVGFEAPNDTTSPADSSLITNPKAEVFAACWCGLFYQKSITETLSSEEIFHSTKNSSHPFGPIEISPTTFCPWAEAMKHDQPLKFFARQK